MASQPSTYNNPLTRMLERGAQRNAGMERREVPVDAGALPSARSVALGQEVLPPLSTEERAELDAKAAALGILPPGEGSEGPYASLDAAMKAGSSLPDLPSAAPLLTSFGMPDARKATVGMMLPVRLPDFTKVGGIDLIRDVVYVDSMEFSISKEDADQFRLYAIQIAHAVITIKLNEAVASLGAIAGGNSGADEVVLPVQDDEGTVPLQ
jgi:hypothetical protein